MGLNAKIKNVSTNLSPRWGFPLASVPQDHLMPFNSALLCPEFEIQMLNSASHLRHSPPDGWAIILEKTDRINSLRS